MILGEGPTSRAAADPTTGTASIITASIITRIGEAATNIGSATAAAGCGARGPGERGEGRVGGAGRDERGGGGQIRVGERRKERGEAEIEIDRSIESDKRQSHC
jgi:hypothetical protein